MAESILSLSTILVHYRLVHELDVEALLTGIGEQRTPAGNRRS